MTKRVTFNRTIDNILNHLNTIPTEDYKSPYALKKSLYKHISYLRYEEIDDDY